MGEGTTGRVRRRILRSAMFGAVGALAGAGLTSPGDSGGTDTPRILTSRDGTRIAYWVGGSGPPLLLVHGASYDHTVWRRVRPALEERFRVYAIDRRGRGASGDAEGYDLAREAEDLASVIDAIGGSVDVVGHSYGGLCALEAARETADLRRLVLYEAVPLLGADAYPPGVLDRLQEQLASGDVDGMLVAMMREIVGRSPDEIERLRSDTEGWAVRRANAASLLREMAAEQAYEFEPGRFTEVRVPALLLVGGESPPRERANAEAVAAVLGGRVEVLPGQGHTAMLMDPEGFARAVLAFLEE